MENYGKLDSSGNLLLSLNQLEGYKPVVYAEIPLEFDETTHYVVQSEPVDEGERIFIGVEMFELQIDEEGEEIAR